MSDTNVELARRGYAAVARGDVEAIREFLDPDVRWHGGHPDAPGSCHSSDDVIAFIDQARRRGGVGELVDVIDAGDQLVVIMRPDPKTHGTRELRANVTTLRDGKVIEMVAYERAEDALAAVGHR